MSPAKVYGWRTEDGRSNPTNRVQTGAASELIASAHLLKSGYHVYRALTAIAPVDLIAIRGDEPPIRVEVKSGCVSAADYHTFFTPKSDNWDLLIVVDREGNVFEYPRAEWTGRQALGHYRTAKRVAREESA